MDDVVQAKAAPTGLEDGRAFLAGCSGLDEAIAGAEEIHGCFGLAAAGKEGGGGRRQKEDRSHHANRPR